MDGGVLGIVGHGRYSPWGHKGLDTTEQLFKCLLSWCAIKTGEQGSSAAPWSLQVTQ